MRRVRLDDSEAIDLLMDAERVRLFEPFLVAPLTVAQAAARRGLTPSAMAYWVKKFVRLGLLRAVESGKTPTYEATADEFVFDLMRGVPFEDVLRRQYSPTWDRMLGALVADYRHVSEDWVMRLYRDERGLIHREGVPEWMLNEPNRPWPPMALNTWGTLRMSKDVARAFQAALEEVVERFGAMASKATDDPEYILHVGFVKAPDE